MTVDLRAVNKVIQSMGPLQPGLHLPSLLLKSWPIIIVDLKDCFFFPTVYLHEQERKFTFLVFALNHSHPLKRYHWKVVAQRMLNSSALCQYFVQQPLEIIHRQFL